MIQPTKVMKAVKAMGNRGCKVHNSIKTTRALMASIELNGYVARKDHEDHIDRHGINEPSGHKSSFYCSVIKTIYFWM
jgi:hypothetical protein